MPPGIALATLARDVHVADRARAARRKLYLLTLLALGRRGRAVAVALAGAARQVYAKNYPAWAGLTPLDVDALWREAGAACTAARVSARGLDGPGDAADRRRDDRRRTRCNSAVVSYGRL